MYLENNTQKMAVRILESHVRLQRVASAYVFSGREGGPEAAEMVSGHASTDIKEEIAVAFACALESKDGKLFGTQDAALAQRIWNRSYPDVRWLGEDKDERSIKIEAVREVIQWSYLKPYEGSWKVCIVLKAERLTEEAANAFLKTLEEPPRRTVFCLLVENKGHLLETIQSRAFEIRLPSHLSQPPVAGIKSLSALPVREIFENYGGLSRDEAKRKLEALMVLSREKVYQLTSEDAEPGEVRRWLEALDLLYESKAALDMNVNQKLMATRLAMRLRRFFPFQKVIL